LYISSKKNSVSIINLKEIQKKPNNKILSQENLNPHQLKIEKPINKPPANVVKIKTKSENIIPEPQIENDINKEQVKNISLKINPSSTSHPVTNRLSKRKDAETQTEEEFFKAHWTFFQNKFTILSAKISKSVVLTTNFKSSNIVSDKNTFSIFNNLGNFETKITNNAGKINLANKNLQRAPSKIIYSASGKK
jgi:hypothetical protein